MLGDPLDAGRNIPMGQSGRWWTRWSALTSTSYAARHISRFLRIHRCHHLLPLVFISRGLCSVGERLKMSFLSGLLGGGGHLLASPTSTLTSTSTISIYQNGFKKHQQTKSTRRFPLYPYCCLESALLSLAVYIY